MDIQRDPILHLHQCGRHVPDISLQYLVKSPRILSDDTELSAVNGVRLYDDVLDLRMNHEYCGVQSFHGPTPTEYFLHDPPEEGHRAVSK